MEPKKIAVKEPLPEFPLDQALLEHASEAREKWLSLRDRIKKIEESRKNVSAQVYERVHRDYAERLVSAQTELMEKREAIEHELSQLRISHDTIAAQLTERKLALEEIEFRHRLHEFDDDEYQAKVEGEREKINKFEAVLSAVKSNIATYEAIFEGAEELIEKPVKHKQTKQGVAEAETGPTGVSGGVLGRYAVENREPKTDENGYILEEEKADYFSNETDEGIDISRTEKETLVEEEPEDKTRPSRLVVISGKNKGAIHSLKDTFTVGRAETNNFAISDPKVSRRQAQIKRHGKDYMIVDLKSSNGTFVNGERIDEHVLSDGDEIQIGDAVLQFHA